MGAFGLNGDLIPPTDHVSRWCKASQVDGDVIGYEAFLLQEKDTDDGLSVNWLEFLQCPDRVSEIAEIQRVLASKMRSVSKNSRIAVLCVEHALNALDERLNGRLKITTVHNPVSEEGVWDDPSHSSLFGLTRDSDADTAAVALRDVISEIHAAAVP